MKTIIGQWSNAGSGRLRLELSKYALIEGTTDNAPRFYSIPLDLNGAIPTAYQIWGNDEIMPEGTSYKRIVFDSYGYIIHGPEQIWISGPPPISLTPETTKTAPSQPLPPPPPPPPPPPITAVSITPAAATIATGTTQQFNATVTPTTANQAVTWTATHGTISSTGLFTAANVATATTAIVTATSVGNTAVSASVVVSITVTTTVTISPGSYTLASGQSLQFTDTVIGNTNHSVTWHAAQGTITAAGLYTAPTVTAATVDTVTVISVADPTASASANVSITAAVNVTVVVSPVNVTLNPSQTQQFNAVVNGITNQSVTWALHTLAAPPLGTISATGLYTAPASVTTFPASDEVQATAVGEPLAQGFATVTLNLGTVATQLDLVQWMVMNARTTNHLVGDPSAPYSVQMLDTDPSYPSNFPSGVIWQLKNKLGNPWDAHSYDSQYITHWITEDGDSVDQAACQASNGTTCWMYARAYKRYITPPHIMPRFFTPNSTITLNNPAPNDVIRTTNCEVTTSTVHIGDVRGVTTGPFKISWGGSIDKGSGTLANGPNYDPVNGVDTIKNQYMYSGTIASGTFADVEEYYYVLGFGEVGWYYYHNNVFVQKTVNNTVASGGHPIPNFPCGPGKSWFV